ncbi:hypothetical protein FACS1894102_4510 [Spirochaetia bacterium]|nr:hypothetical protein FACS1894102_4510 [Spirochaetia bacterium]
MIVQIYKQAFTSDTDAKLSIKLIPGILICLLSASLWFVMNGSFNLRHSPQSFPVTTSVIASVVLCVLFSGILYVTKRYRSFFIVPLAFVVFPVAYLLIANWGESLKTIVPATTAAGGLDWKFVYDIFWIITELALMVPIFILCRLKNPLPLKRKQKTQSALPCAKAVIFIDIFFIVGVLALMVHILVQANFPLKRFVSLLKYQIPFGILMGFKEEFFFRWILVRLIERLLKSRIAAVCISVFVWGMYHALFGGESVGVGFFAGFLTCVCSFWWTFTTYRNNSLWASFAGHTVIEWYGFYLMYIHYMTV